jgi:hypothetical protein
MCGWILDLKLLTFTLLMWGKALCKGLLVDLGWKLGLFVPWADGLRYDKSIAAQMLEWTVRGQAKCMGLRWRQVEGGALHGIRLQFRFWCEVWAARREVREARRQFDQLRRAINRHYGLKLESPEMVQRFLHFLAEQSTGPDKKSEV